MRVWFELHRLTATLRNVWRLALRKGRERQALQAVHRAPILHADERARVLEAVGVLVQVGVKPRNGGVGHSTRFARYRGVVRLRDLRIVVLGSLGAPLVHLRLYHQDLAVISVVRRQARRAHAYAARGSDIEASTCTSESG